MIAIGDYVTFRSWKAFFNGATTLNGRNYLIQRMRQLVELDGLILIEVLRVSKQKWQVVEVCTEENNYCLEDDNVFLKAGFYDTKELLAAKPTKWYNALTGEQTEYRVYADREEAQT
jgi:hypothetical protein